MTHLLTQELVIVLPWLIQQKRFKNNLLKKQLKKKKKNPNLKNAISKMFRM